MSTSQLLSFYELEGFDEDNYLDNLTLFLVLPTCINKLVLTSARDLRYC